VTEEGTAYSHEKIRIFWVKKKKVLKHRNAVGNNFQEKKNFKRIWNRTQKQRVREGPGGNFLKRAIYRQEEVGIFNGKSGDRK